MQNRRKEKSGYLDNAMFRDVIYRNIHDPVIIIRVKIYNCRLNMTFENRQTLL